jgi:hypothetical protein
VRVKINSTSTRPSRFVLCSANAGAKVLDRRRPQRRWLTEPADEPLGGAPDLAATTKETDGVVVGAPKFGNAKDMVGCEYP